MNSFLHRHADGVIGVLSGFDRLVFRGYLKGIVYPEGMKGFLWKAGVYLKEFDKFVERATNQLKQASLAEARRLGRRVVPVASNKTVKEEIAVDVMKKDEIKEGLICVLKCQEPSLSFEVSKNIEKRLLELRSRIRPSQHLYHYSIDPVFGFMSARIQTYFPFGVQVCINGREWLARAMDRAGMKYDRRDNCFAKIDNVKRAQRLMSAQLRIAWPKALGRLARQLNPAHEAIFRAAPGIDYYWVVHQSEWATDVMFRDAATLAPLYRPWIHHGITSFSSPDVMRFLGRKVLGRFSGEVVSDFKDRPEGVRIKHRLNQNSVKLYDKQGSIARIETTLNSPKGFKVFRPKEGDPKGKRSWRPLRKGIADLHRRAQVSQAANNNYMEALATVVSTTEIGELVEPLCRRIKWKSAQVRGLKPWAQGDLALMKAVSRGEFCLNGFRNRDLQPYLYAAPTTSLLERRRRTGAVTRLIRLLRAHGLVKKVPATHRYRLSDNGRQVFVAVLSMQTTTLEQLAKLSA